MNTNAHNAGFLQMIAYAVKAPSGHNTQSWLFEVQDHKIIISPNNAKALPAVDADNRELFISLGCATENLCLVASALQYSASAQVDSVGNITVYLKKSADITPSPLYKQIEKRQTNRAKYNGTPISADIIANLLKTQSDDNKIFAWAKGADEFTKLSEFVVQGNLLQLNDPAFKKELLSWIRFNKTHADATNDGLSYAVMGAPNLPKFITKAIVTLALNPNTQNKADLTKIHSSSHLLLLTSKENDVAAWVATGRVLQRLLLTLSQHNIAAAYLNQPCENQGLNKQMQAQLPIDKQYPQILLRIGYADPMPYSKRRAIAEVIKYSESTK